MEEDLQKTTEVVQKEKEVEEKFEKLNTTYEQLKCRFDDLQADKSAEIADLQANIAVLEEVRIEHGVLNKKCQELEKIIEDKKLVEQSQQEGEVLITELRANLEEKSKNEEELRTELEKVKEESSKEAQSLQAKIVENEEKFKVGDLKIFCPIHHVYHMCPIAVHNCMCLCAKCRILSTFIQKKLVQTSRVSFGGN